MNKLLFFALVQETMLQITWVSHIQIIDSLEKLLRGKNDTLLV